mmetsp:Transcript_29001/g.93118  ORF Transcript_29001/g.93118 Transcript_29001/m.93118 type:complete len:290 (+) Transcript_29001:79-948(+)
MKVEAVAKASVVFLCLFSRQIDTSASTGKCEEDGSALLQMHRTRATALLQLHEVAPSLGTALLSEPMQPKKKQEPFVVLPDAWQRLEFRMPQEGRPEACVQRTYNVSKMPSVAVIIPYLNESLELLEHTVGSLIKNTDPYLLDEILLVDDGNDADHAFASTLMRLHPKVKYHRNAERQGLIKAKTTGADLTKSPVIVFMEPHCIVNRFWLEPLLDRRIPCRRRRRTSTNTSMPTTAASGGTWSSIGWALRRIGTLRTTYLTRSQCHAFPVASWRCGEIGGRTAGSTTIR